MEEEVSKTWKILSVFSFNLNIENGKEQFENLNLVPFKYSKWKENLKIMKLWTFHKMEGESISKT